MAEVLIEYQSPVGAGGVRYHARACGKATDIGTWEGWIEFVPETGGEVLRSPRETTQPNKMDTVYWATGLTPVYLEGALDRALHPVVVAVPRLPGAPEYDGPAPAREIGMSESSPPAVLDPFSVYEKGEALLRQQLSALSEWHLVNIIDAYGLSREDPTMLSRLSRRALVDLIIAGVRQLAS